MRELKATPGPWDYRPAAGVMHARIESSGKRVFLFKTDPRNADGQLAAAAPELYELLEMVFLSIDGGGRVVTFSDDDYEAMREALAKARGESDAD